MTPDQARNLLRKACAKEGGLRAFARRYKLSAAYVSDALRGNRDFGPSLCRIFRLRRIVTRAVSYERIKQPRGELAGWRS